MKKIIFTSFLICSLISGSFGQHKGNYNANNKEISRANIATAGNAVIYNTSSPTINSNLTPSNIITVEVKGLQNVKASSYTAIFNLSQIGPSADETNKLAKERIDAVKQSLLSNGINKDDIIVDVISFIPVYEIEVEKKIFSKKYNDVPKGFELQQNIHIKFTNPQQFESILGTCAKNEIYNLVKVDYYIDDIAAVYKDLQKELLQLISEKKEYYSILGFDLNTYNATIADNKYCYFPKDFYKSYQAYNSISFEAIKKNKGVTKAKKQTSYYYDPIPYSDYDVVINTAIIEPVIQVGMHIKLQYTPKPVEKTPKPKVKTEIKNKYFLIAPDGKMDVRELPIN